VILATRLRDFGGLGEVSDNVGEVCTEREISRRREETP